MLASSSNPLAYAKIASKNPIVDSREPRLVGRPFFWQCDHLANRWELSTGILAGDIDER